MAGTYVQPHQLVEVEPGRRINLYCQGTGSPTVLFDSGLSDWSATWARIQPAVATRTRACSYDRPGMGYSDPPKRPATPLNVVDDLHTLLQQSGIEGPLLLVGHSLGGFNMKLYAALHPDQVAGLVLVDPSEERMWDRVGAALTPRFGAKLVRQAATDDAEGFPELVKHFKECTATTRAGKPMVVLTHSFWEMTPPFGEIGWQSWVTAHQQSAALSSRGTQRMVPMTRHNIQVDQPQAVIDAVVEVLDAIR